MNYINHHSSQFLNGLNVSDEDNYGNEDQNILALVHINKLMVPVNEASMPQDKISQRSLIAA